MYALYGADGKISLYEGGNHEHGKVRVPGSLLPYPTMDVCAIRRWNSAMCQVFPVHGLGIPMDPRHQLLPVPGGNTTGEKLCTIAGLCLVTHLLISYFKTCS